EESARTAPEGESRLSLSFTGRAPKYVSLDAPASTARFQPDPPTATRPRGDDLRCGRDIRAIREFTGIMRQLKPRWCLRSPAFGAASQNSAEPRIGCARAASNAIFHGAVPGREVSA